MKNLENLDLNKLKLQLFMAARDAKIYGVGFLVVDKNTEITYIDLEEAKEILEKTESES